MKKIQFNDNLMIDYWNNVPIDGWFLIDLANRLRPDIFDRLKDVSGLGLYTIL